jgi:hypothetical protein
MQETPETVFACPLIVSIPQGEYQSVVFIDGGKQVKTLKIDRRPRGKDRAPKKTR